MIANPNVAVRAYMYIRQHIRITSNTNPNNLAMEDSDYSETRRRKHSLSSRLFHLHLGSDKQVLCTPPVEHVGSHSSTPLNR